MAKRSSRNVGTRSALVFRDQEAGGPKAREKDWVRSEVGPEYLQT